jgi:hypothetical protein
VPARTSLPLRSVKYVSAPSANTIDRADVDVSEWLSGGVLSVTKIPSSIHRGYPSPRRGPPMVRSERSWDGAAPLAAIGGHAVTRNPWCAPINSLRDVLYDETRPQVHDSRSLFEGIVKATILTAAIEIDVALLRALAGCPQQYPVRRVAMGARALVPIGTPAYWTATPIT